MKQDNLNNFIRALLKQDKSKALELVYSGLSRRDLYSAFKWSVDQKSCACALACLNQIRYNLSLDEDEQRMFSDVVHESFMLAIFQHDEHMFISLLNSCKSIFINDEQVESILIGLCRHKLTLCLDVFLAQWLKPGISWNVVFHVQQILIACVDVNAPECIVVIMKHIAGGTKALTLSESMVEPAIARAVIQEKVQCLQTLLFEDETNTSIESYSYITDWLKSYRSQSHLLNVFVAAFVGKELEGKTNA